MAQPNRLRKKLIAILKATISGGALFAGVYLVVVLADQHLWGPSLLGYFVSAPPELVRAAMGSRWPAESFVAVLLFEVIVDAGLGALVFLLGATVFQFAIKGELET